MRRLIGWGLALVTAVVVMVNQQGVGIARDEVIYIQSGERYASWWLGLAKLEHGITERSVTEAFGGPSPTDNNREHPALMKTLFGLSEMLLHERLGVTDEVTASRLPSALLAGVAVLLVYILVLELWGLAEAIVSALLLMLLPRAMFHAGLACFDAPTMTLWLATVYAYWRGLDGRRWPWHAGVIWGLALATKHTALLLPFALGAHYLLVAWRAQRRAGATSVTLRAVIGYRWRVLVSLVVLGPLTLYLVWPWLWFDPVHHVRDWLAFHTSHVHYNYEYLGRNWNAPRFPWHVALVTTLFTVPVATLAAAIAGAGAWIADRAHRNPGAPGVLLALSAAASIGPFFLGTTPIFGAEKHWMPVLPSICIAAGVGVVWAARTAAGYAATRIARLSARHAQAFAIAALGAGVVLASVVETRTAEPYALTWYNALAGGAPGGADLGMNRQYWGASARGVLPRLSIEAQPAGTTYVYTHDASPAWRLYQRLGLIPTTLVDAGWEQGGIDRSQLAIVIHERHFNRHDYLIWSAYRTVQPIDVLVTHGVPIVSVYRRPGDRPGERPGADPAPAGVVQPR